ncbi:MAG: hypothetical protein IH587_13655 [Anaerolineae bacterium]|nr:hypothetical protein [Anaerolineae bacterium]
MSQYLYLLRPARLEMLTDGGTPDEVRIVGEHFNHLQAQIEAGVAILLGRTQNDDASTFGIVIFNADDEDSARVIMDSDPAVKYGVMTAELFPYRIALIREANVIEA